MLMIKLLLRAGIGQAVQACSLYLKTAISLLDTLKAAYFVIFAIEHKMMHKCFLNNCTNNLCQEKKLFGDLSSSVDDRSFCTSNIIMNIEKRHFKWVLETVFNNES